MYCENFTFRFLLSFNHEFLQNTWIWKVRLWRDFKALPISFVFASLFFFAGRNENWETAFENCSFAYPIDMTCHWHSDLCDFHYFFFCDCFFLWNSFVRVSYSAEWHMKNILRAFIISNLWKKKQSMRNELEIFISFARGYCVINSLSLAYKNIM